MAQVEGLGLRAPAAEKIVFTEHEVGCVVDEAKRRASFRNYESRSDAWGKGLLDSVVLPNIGSLTGQELGIAAGIIGEYALACKVNRHFGEICRVDTTLRQYGDGGVDLAPFGLATDAKARITDYDTYLIKAARPDGSRCRWKCEAFVFAFWDQYRTVELSGWVWAADQISKPLCPARRGDHWNVEVETSELLSMRRYIDELRSRKEWL